MQLIRGRMELNKKEKTEIARAIKDIILKNKLGDKPLTVHIFNKRENFILCLDAQLAAVQEKGYKKYCTIIWRSAMKPTISTLINYIY